MAVRDTQRSKLYQWETEVLEPMDNETMPLSECEALIKKVWRKVGGGVVAPSVGDGRRSRRGHYSRSEHRIRLPKFARRRWYVLHEVAHAIPHKGSWHGPEFCARYANLLQRFGGWTAVRKSMRAFGLKVKAG